MEWELSKENFVPVKQGRAQAVLSELVDQTDSVGKSAIEQKKRKLWQEVTEYDGDDPLEPWQRLIRWTQEHLVGASKTELQKILEVCTKQLMQLDRYRSDIRFLRIWIQYADCLPDPADVFCFLKEKQIGQEFALFYEAHATHYELKGNCPAADKVYQDGINRCARPLERLKQKYTAFQTRMAQRIQRKIQEEVLLGPGAADLATPAARASLAPLAALQPALRGAQQAPAARHATSALGTTGHTLGTTAALAPPPSLFGNHGVHAHASSSGRSTGSSGGSSQPFGLPNISRPGGQQTGISAGAAASALAIFTDQEFTEGAARPSDGLSSAHTAVPQPNHLQQLKPYNIIRKENIQQPSIWTAAAMPQSRSHLMQQTAPPCKLEVCVDDEFQEQSATAAPAAAASHGLQHGWGSRAPSAALGLLPGMQHSSHPLATVPLDATAASGPTGAAAPHMQQAVGRHLQAPALAGPTAAAAAAPVTATAPALHTGQAGAAAGSKNGYDPSLLVGTDGEEASFEEARAARTYAVHHTCTASIGHLNRHAAGAADTLAASGQAGSSFIAGTSASSSASCAVGRQHTFSHHPTTATMPASAAAPAAAVGPLSTAAPAAAAMLTAKAAVLGMAALPHASKPQAFEFATKLGCTAPATGLTHRPAANVAIPGAGHIDQSRGQAPAAAAAAGPAPGHAAPGQTQQADGAHRVPAIMPLPIICPLPLHQQQHQHQLHASTTQHTAAVPFSNLPMAAPSVPSSSSSSGMQVLPAASSFSSSSSLSHGVSTLAGSSSTCGAAAVAGQHAVSAQQPAADTAAPEHRCKGAALPAIGQPQPVDRQLPTSASSISPASEPTLTISTREAFDVLNSMFSGSDDNDSHSGKPKQDAAHRAQPVMPPEPTVTINTKKAFDALNDMFNDRLPHETGSGRPRSCSQGLPGLPAASKPIKTLDVCRLANSSKLLNSRANGNTMQPYEDTDFVTKRLGSSTIPSQQQQQQAGAAAPSADIYEDTQFMTTSVPGSSCQPPCQPVNKLVLGKQHAKSMQTAIDANDKEISHCAHSSLPSFPVYEDTDFVRLPGNITTVSGPGAATGSNAAGVADRQRHDMRKPQAAPHTSNPATLLVYEDTEFVQPHQHAWQHAAAPAPAAAAAVYEDTTLLQPELAAAAAAAADAGSATAMYEDTEFLTHHLPAAGSFHTYQDTVTLANAGRRSGEAAGPTATARGPAAASAGLRLPL